MTELLLDFPETTFKGDALTSIGKTQIERNEMEKAKAAFDQIRRELPGSGFAKRALVDLALVAIKQGEDEAALALWAQISSQYPEDEVTKDAFLLVEPLLVERGQLDNLPDVVGLSEDDIAERTYAAAQELGLVWRLPKSNTEADPIFRRSPSKHPHLGCGLSFGSLPI